MENQNKKKLEFESTNIEHISIKSVHTDTHAEKKTEQKAKIIGPAITVGLHVIIVALVFLGLYLLYHNHVGKDVAEVKFENVHFCIDEPYPSWLYISEATMSTLKPITEMDKETLYNLVAQNDSNSISFKTKINELAYLSQKNSRYIIVIYAMLCLISILGCLVRNMYDFIGHHCYTNRLDMSVWWPWYILRPIIAACLSVLLYIISLGNIFEMESLSSTNNLLIISFFVGFAIQDVITLLRKISKTIFVVEDKDK